MIIVTGGAGFIGSNLILALNKMGIRNIIVVDDLSDGKKMFNLVDLDILDYLDYREFITRINGNLEFHDIRVVFHLGACSSTTEWDGEYLMRVNYEYSKKLLNWCNLINAQFIYASSASVYGLGNLGFKEIRSCEIPINMYAYSKFLFDQYVRHRLPSLKCQAVGLRYFNVYGPREKHKSSMASVVYHFNNQVLSNRAVKLFEGNDGCGNGEQSRDFVYVNDCVEVNLWFMNNPSKIGIFNVGSGTSTSYNDLARAVINWHNKNSGIIAEIEYIPFPRKLVGSYQNYTLADLTALRAIGYKKIFSDIECGVSQYLSEVNNC